MTSFGITDEQLLQNLAPQLLNQIKTELLPPPLKEHFEHDEDVCELHLEYGHLAKTV